MAWPARTTATSSALRARQIYDWQKHEHKQVSVVTVGRKGRDWMLRHGPPLRAEFTGLDRPTSNDIAPVAHVLIEDFIAGVYDAVYLASTTLRQHAAPGTGDPPVAAHRAAGA